MSCTKCDTYKKESEKYKKEYEIAKSGLTADERNELIGLICNEQVIHIIAKGEYNSDRYKMLEELKMKIRIM